MLTGDRNVWWDVGLTQTAELRAIGTARLMMRRKVQTIVGGDHRWQRSITGLLKD